MLDHTTAVRRAIMTAAVLAIASVSSAQDVNEPVGAKVSLPENPCYILTTQQVARATGLEVVDAKRVPGADGATPGTTCSYETKGEFGAITIVIPPPSEQSAAKYKEKRDAVLGQSGTSAQKITGIGQDAWLAGGATLSVLAGDNAHFAVATQHAHPRSQQLLVDLAKAILRRVKS